MDPHMSIGMVELHMHTYKVHICMFEVGCTHWIFLFLRSSLEYSNSFFSSFCQSNRCGTTLLHFDHGTNHVLVWSHKYHSTSSESECKRGNVSLENAEFLSLALLVGVICTQLPGGAWKQQLVQLSLHWSCSLIRSAVLPLCVCVGTYVHLCTSH